MKKGWLITGIILIVLVVVALIGPLTGFERNHPDITELVVGGIIFCLVGVFCIFKGIKGRK